jgi:hypothetical protein
VIEKLLENWLDKASERSYQAVFVQMLAADGYKVLHSTRHCLLEFGKDILAVAPDGVGCAFQLKGQPGGRMQIAEFRRDIQPQLVQLMAQSPSYAGFPSGAHRSYLVSNGQFEEEVQAATRDMNTSPYPSKLILWGRGDLLSMCRRNAEQLWPSELGDNKSLLELYMLNPRGKPPTALLGDMLASILSLSDSGKQLGRAEFIRASSSAAWVTGIAIASFAEAQNHHAVALAWTQCCVALIGAAEKHAGGNLSEISSSFEVAKSAVLDALSALWEELRGRETLVEGDPMTDADIFSWRITTLFGLLTCLAIADQSQSLLDEQSREGLHLWLTRNGFQFGMWGEAAVASVIPWIVWLRKNNATSRVDREILALARNLVNVNQRDSGLELPSPYYDGEEALSMAMGLKKNPIEQLESFSGSIYTAEAAMHLLVRANMKQSCKSLWPNFTKLSHRSLKLVTVSDYCTLRATRGVDETKIYASTYEWAQLKSDALAPNSAAMVSKLLAQTPWLLAMWWQTAPHRINTDAARIFA